MPVVLSTPTPTYEPGLFIASPSASVILASTSPPAPPQATVGPSDGTIQLTTIFGIVVGLVGFVILVLAGSFMSRLPCANRRLPSVSPQPRSRPLTHVNIRKTLLSERPCPMTFDVFCPHTAGRTLHERNHHSSGSRSRPRPPIQHVEQTIAVVPILMDHWPQPCDHSTCPPPYGGPSPPPYSEVLRHPPQDLHAPPRAVVEA
ncbi:hypothetical protein V8E55_004255 [Tylopilus felleus]